MTLIPIGQFSSMTRLSVKALRLYDSKGILCPAYVDPDTQYRYYRVEQADRAEAIRLLRSVEMPLDDIRNILDAKDQEEAGRRLRAHRERLAERVAAQERMLAYLESIIRRKEIAMSYSIEVTEVEPTHVAGVRMHTDLGHIAGDIYAGLGTLMAAVQRSGNAPSGEPLTVYHDVIDEETAGDVEVCVPVAPDFVGDETVAVRELEGGPMATTIHRGPYEELSRAYRMLTHWIGEQGYEIVGPPREFYLNDPREVPPEELLTRVEWPVSGRSAAS